MDFLGVMTTEPAKEPCGARADSGGHPRESLHGKKQEFPSDPTTARVVIGGNNVGRMEWQENESSRSIVVFGEEPPVAPIAEEIARTLGATFRPG